MWKRIRDFFDGLISVIALIGEAIGGFLGLFG